MVSKGGGTLITLYKFLSLYFSKIPLFKKIGLLIISKRLISACNYYRDYYNLKAEEISAACIGLTVLIIILGGVSFTIFRLLIILPAASIIAITTPSLFYYKIINEYDNENRKISRYADEITQNFIFAFQLSSSIFDALKYVAKAEYPVISDKFKEIIYKVNLGENPHKLLEEFLKKQPSEALRNNLLHIIKTRKVDSHYEEILGVESHRTLREEYENFTLQVENKIMIVAASNVFLPLILGLGLIFWGLGETPFFIILIPVHLVLSLALKKKLLKKRDELFEN